MTFNDVSTQKSGQKTLWNIPATRIVGIILTPLLIAAIFIWGLWDPATRLENIRAAVVNLDEPVEVDGQITPLGRVLAAELIGSKVSENFAWELTSAEEASRGLETGEYITVVTIPENFSAAATSLSDGPATAQQANIDIETSERAKLLDPALSGAVTSVALKVINDQLGKAFIENILVGMNQLGDGLDQAAAGAGDLSSGAAQFSEGLQEYALGTSDFETGLNQYAQGSQTYADGMQTFASGTNELAAGTRELAAGTKELASGTQQLSSGTDQLADGMSQLSGGVQEITEGVRELHDKFGQIAAGTEETAGGAHELAAGIKEYTDGINSITEPLYEYIVGIPPFDEYLKQIVDEAVADGKITAEEGDQIIEFGGQLADLTGDAAEQLEKLADEATTQLDAMIEGGKDLSQGSQDLAEGISAISEGLNQVNDGIGDLSAGMLELRDGASELNTGAAELNVGVKELNAGTQSLNSGVGELSSGAVDLSAGAAELNAGATQLSTGAAGLASGAGELREGAHGLADGSEQLASGAGELATGIDTIATEIPRYTDDETAKFADIIIEPVADGGNETSFFQGTGAPLFVTLALWAGALASFLLLTPLWPRTREASLSEAAITFKSVTPGALLGVLQGAAVGIGVGAILNVTPQQFLAFVALTSLIGVIFAVINQSLVALLGGYGKFISIAIMTIGFVAGILSTTPDSIGALASFTPFGVAESSINHALDASSSAVGSIIWIIVWGAVGFFLTGWAVHRKRAN